MRSNWAGNIRFGADRNHLPRNIDEICDVVRRAERLGIVGARHSFNDIADTAGELICLERYDHPIAIDRALSHATVSAGATYEDIAPAIHESGHALANMASLPHVTVAGACATATHGSGDALGNLATAVAALSFVTANGEQVEVSGEDDAEQLSGLAVGLGGFGVLTSMKLHLVPTFAMQQEIYVGLAMADLGAHFEDIMASAYSVCLFTDWRIARIDHLRIKYQTTETEAFEAPREFFGARHMPLEAVPGEENEDWVARSCGTIGPWYEHLPHFALNNPVATGYELQTEYFIPREHAVEAFQAIMRVQPVFEELITLTEIRSVAADELWMSPAYQRPTIGIHFGWQKNWAAVKKVLPIIEEALAPFDARPHWGKLFTMAPQRLRALYPRYPDFRALLQSHDPTGKFRNDFLDRCIFEAL